MNEKIKLQLRVKTAQVFRPGAPIDKYELFAGRREQVNDIISAIMQPGRHVILYGERGVGKTSLAKVMGEVLSGSGFTMPQSATLNCDGTDTFSSLWHKIFRELTFVSRVSTIGFQSGENYQNIVLDVLLPETVTPDDIRYAFQHFQNHPMIVIIDELDRIRGQETTTLLADTIKTLSDHAIDATLILVGIADSVDGLIAEHRSIERALVQVHVPRMSRDELFQILDKGYTQIGMHIEANAREYIAALSQGLPHYTHALGLYSTLEAVEANRTTVNMEDVSKAMGLTVQKSQSILSDYYKAIISPQKLNLYVQVLLACALAPKDALGYFSAGDVRGPMSKIMGKSYEIPAYSRHLDEFCEPRRGPVLQKTGDTRKFRFRFVNPLMQPFVIIEGLSKSLIVTGDILRVQ